MAKLIKLKKCKVPLCDNNRDIPKWYFCPDCMRATVRRIMGLPQNIIISDYTQEQLEEANNLINMININWKSLVEQEKISIALYGPDYDRDKK